MKVNDEMVERAVAEWRKRTAYSTPGSGHGVLRDALEAALADIPDPEEVRAEIMEGLAYGRSVERQMLDARIAELEAKLEAAQLYDRDVRIGQLRELEEKLEKVRAWIAKHDEGIDALPYDIAPDYGELGAILDGKEQT